MVLLGFFLSTVSAGATENTNEPHVRPEAKVAQTSKPPKIDGELSVGEWQGLHVSSFVAQRAGGKDFLQPRPGEFWVTTDGKDLFIAVRSAVHPKAGVLAQHKPQGKKAMAEALYDDSIELWIDNQPASGGGEYYQFLVNSLGAMLTKMHDRKDGSANLWWRSEGLRQAHKVEDGSWVAEFAIPLADLEIADVAGGIGLRVCRNYKYPWDQSRWAPNVNAFDSAETMGRVRFSGSAPTISETGFQDEEGIAVGIEVANPGKAPLPVKVKLGYNAEQQPRYFEEREETIAPGTSKPFVYRKEFFSPENYPALAEILVTSPDGETVYYHRDVKWNTKPGQVWEKIAAATIDDAFSFDIEWHPTPKLLRWRTDFSAYTGRDSVDKLRVAVRSQKDSKVFKEFQFPVPENGRVEEKLDLSQLPDGMFAAELYVDEKGKKSDKPAKIQIFEQRSDFPWLNSKIGTSDEVIPPFTPLVVKGNRIDAILRSYTMTDTGLWGSIVADGEELLAAPMRFEVIQGGKMEDVSGAIKFLETKPNVVVSEARWNAGGLRGVTRSELEYDGAMKVTLELTQEGDTPVDSMELVIPLRDAFMPLMHACGDGLRINYAGAVSKGEGEVWSSIKASRANLLGTFLPYLWVGEEARGVTWFASNDRDWVVQMDDSIPALSLVRDGETLNLRVRLIQKPTVLTRSHTITFGLMATPAKPMPEGWRLQTLNQSGDTNMTFLGMTMYWGGELFGVFPHDRDFTVVQKIADGAKGGQLDPEYFEKYTQANPTTAREIEWSSRLRNAGTLVPYTNIRGEMTGTPDWRVYQDEWRRGNFSWRLTDPEVKSGQIDFSVIPTPSRIDYLLYYYREFLTHGMDGIYWDNICIYSNANEVTGDGYTREDGTFQPESDIWRLREVTKRAAVLAHELGKKKNINMPHMTNAELAPVFSWTGFYLGWEWKYGETDWQERFSREYIRAINLGRHTGNIPGVIEGQTHQIKDTELRAHVRRTRAGVVLTHEIIVQHADPLLIEIREALFGIGYGTDKAKVFNYWDKNPVATVTGLDTSWLVVDGPDIVMVIVCDWGGGGKDGRVTLDTQRLGLPADFSASNWFHPENKQTAKNGTFAVGEIDRHDFVVFTIPKKP